MARSEAYENHAWDSDTDIASHHYFSFTTAGQGLATRCWNCVLRVHSDLEPISTIQVTGVPFEMDFLEGSDAWYVGCQTSHRSLLLPQ